MKSKNHFVKCLADGELPLERKDIERSCGFGFASRFNTVKTSFFTAMMRDKKGGFLYE